MNEVNNTARALRDQPLLVTSMWCKFGWHAWTKWNNPSSEKSTIIVTQIKYCVHCNEYKVRKVDVPSY